MQITGRAQDARLGRVYLARCVGVLYGGDLWRQLDRMHSYVKLACNGDRVLYIYIYIYICIYIIERPKALRQGAATRADLVGRDYSNMAVAHERRTAVSMKTDT